MDNQLQPLYNITLNGVDVTDNVTGDVVYEETQELFSTLKFKLSNAYLFLGHQGITFGSPVTLYGGSYGDETNQKQFFKGTIRTFKPIYKDNGVTEVSITCYGGDWKKYAGVEERFIYPSVDSPRKWADVETLKASEIIRKIVNTEMKSAFGKITVDGIKQDALILQVDREYTLTTPTTQNFKSDWAYLRELADKLNCALWVEHNPVTEQNDIFFVDRDVSRNAAVPISFLYPGRDELGFNAEELGQNQLQLLSFDLTQDADAANSNLRTMTKFDPATGENKTLFYRYDVEKEEYFFYELDYNKVQNEQDDVLFKLFQKGAVSIPWERKPGAPETEVQAKDYFKRSVVDIKPTEDFTVHGRPWIGIDATGTVEGDIRLKANRSYGIYGITSRFESKNSKGFYYCVSCSHSWTDRGYFTELTFKR